MNRRWLAPLVPLYAAGLAWRSKQHRHPQRLAWPVLSIGNLSTGGSGKTPLAMALAERLTARGIAVDVLSRGYGRQSHLPMRVDPAGSADQFGDEPLLIARATGVSVYVAAQRYQAGLLAEAGADRAPSGQQDLTGSQRPHAHILDDGFQHRQLARTIDILLLDRADFHDTLLPAGNLREALRAAKRADVLAIPAGDPAFEADLRVWGWQGPLWRLRRPMEVPVVAGPVVAFCGIARPHQFFSGLAATGMRLPRRISFPDHHRYTPRDIKQLDEAVERAGAVALLTTEKDKVRLGSLAPSRPLLSVGLRTEIDDEQGVLDWLADRIKAAQSV
jgi:tetraacyldisaccharide 4'-kinase